MSIPAEPLVAYFGKEISSKPSRTLLIFTVELLIINVVYF